MSTGADRSVSGHRIAVKPIARPISSLARSSEGVTTSAVQLFDPFGQPLDPATSAIGLSAVRQDGQATESGWHQGARKPVDTIGSFSVTEMGVRLYVASLGRFLSVDSVEGGAANDYVYVLDPVGAADLSGKSAEQDAIDILDLISVFTVGPVSLGAGLVATGATCVYRGVFHHECTRGIAASILGNLVAPGFSSAMRIGQRISVPLSVAMASRVQHRGPIRAGNVIHRFFRRVADHAYHQPGLIERALAGVIYAVSGGGSMLTHKYY